MLSCSVLAIFCQLEKVKAVTDDMHAYKFEKRILLCILLTFNSSYILRLIYDIILAQETEDSDERGYFGIGALLALAIGPNFFDLIPVWCILYIHSLYIIVFLLRFPKHTLAFYNNNVSRSHRN